MKMRTSLFSGIAFLAIANAAPALAQTDSATPRHHRHHARSSQARSGPQYSTPEEQAATERLNEQQLQLAKVAQSTPNTMAAQPGSQMTPTSDQQPSPPADQPHR